MGFVCINIHGPDTTYREIIGFKVENLFEPVFRSAIGISSLAFVKFATKIFILLPILPDGW